MSVGRTKLTALKVSLTQLLTPGAMTGPVVLWPHQLSAVNNSLANDFKSGTHAHATGTGKTFVGTSIVRAFVKSRARPCVIFWVCEQGPVLRQTFADRAHWKGMLVCDLVTRKPGDWYRNVANAKTWGMPIVVAVNRAFLVSRERYKRLPADCIDLVVHDECHSGAGSTMVEFYNWLQRAQPSARVIGLSATPPSLKDAPYAPLATVHSRFSIYDATECGIIVPIRMYWSDDNGSLVDWVQVILHLANKHNVGKILVWCGMIEHCAAMAKVWRANANASCRSWTVSVDTSHDSKEWASYDEFCAAKDSAILFCAAKHREGSDITGLGMCVFVDGVARRGPAVFTQCAGRVLRRNKDGSPKPCGVVVDLRARDGLELCDRLGKYLQLPRGVLPWKAGKTECPTGAMAWLELSPSTERRVARTQCDQQSVGIAELRKMFVRSVPTDALYQERLERELSLIDSKSLGIHLKRAVEVLALAGTEIPHVTRGSCGSSLVCYLLGISHVDPVKHAICFARFLNEFRSSLPDIDFDFPHDQRADIFMGMALRWPGCVARISNHVHYHEKSALRESLRHHGLDGAVPALEIGSYVASLPKQRRVAVERYAKQLDGTFNCFSLHCGGVVYYPEGVDEADLLSSKEGGLMAQVKLDKRDVAGKGQFKIDVLSSRALAQLQDSVATVPGAVLQLDEPPFTEEMAERFASGDNIGVTLAESPLARSEFIERRPRSVSEVAECLALIRPAARQSKGTIIYDDDAIAIIQKALGCSEAEADGLRRGMAKKDKAALRTVEERLGKQRCKRLVEDLGTLSLYGFCKSHAMSYAQLVCWLMWAKCQAPAHFWRATLNHCQSSYKPWVHLWEAARAGVSLDDKSLRLNRASIYAMARKASTRTMTDKELLYKHWRWDFRSGFYYECSPPCEGNIGKFVALIASSRHLSDDSVALSFSWGDGYNEAVCSSKGFHGGCRKVSGILMPDGTVESAGYS